MAPDGPLASSDIADKIIAIRDAWHTKQHPLFLRMQDGSLDLRPLGIYMAQHYKFVSLALPSFGLLYWRAPDDIRRALVENMAEEHGLAAIPVEGHEPHDHQEMIFDFCHAAGLSTDEIENMEPTPAWWGRTLHYVHTLREEQLGVVLAMQFTQEGQQPALNEEVTIPSFVQHYGFTRDSKEIAFFVEHAEADQEHSRRQIELAVKYLQTPEDEERALKVCEEACRLRWASISDIYREHVLKSDDLLPPGIAA